MERVSNAKSKELVSGSGPSLKRGTATDGGGFGASARSGMEAQLLKELSGEGELSDVEKSNLEQNVRAAQVARGNYGGGSAEFQEAFGKTGAVERRKRENRGELLNYLSSGQSSFDVANRLRGEDNALSQTEFGNLLSAITQRNDASQSDFENLLAAGNQRNEASQLDFNNLLSASNQRNAANQADFSNDALSMGQRNAASQADFENQLNLVQQNNATQQQNFSNIGSVIDQNNRAAQIDTENRNNQTSLQNSVEMQDYQNRLTELNSINAARQQQISNLGSFTSGTPMGQVAAMNAGAQALPVPISGSNILNFMGVNPNAGQAGADFALGVFGQQGLTTGLALIIRRTCTEPIRLTIVRFLGLAQLVKPIRSALASEDRRNMPLFNFDFTGVSSARKEAEQARREEYTQRAEYYKALAEKNNFDRLESMRLSAGNYTPKEISDMDLKSSESTKNYAQAQDYRSQALSRAPYNDPLTRDKTSAEVSLTMAQARSANSKAALEEEEVENQRAYGNSVKNYVATMQNFGEQIGQAEGELASLRIARKQDPQNMTLIAAEAGVVRKIEGSTRQKP